MIEVAAAKFTFDPIELQLDPRDEVTLRIRNEGATMYNIEIPEYGVFVESAPGKSTKTTFVVPNGIQAASFFCNISDYREAGMEETIASG